jgi:starvation-inducible DNA-binding protein
MAHNRNDDPKPKLQVPIEPGIDVRRAVVEILNNTLANEAMLSLKTRSAHWNGSGPCFLELHALYKAQYKQLNNISDEIAERVRMLGGLPIGSFEGLLKHARLEEHAGIVPNMMNLLADHEAAIRFLREDAKKCLEEYENEVTRNFLVSVQYLHEKMVCILRAHIEPQLTGDQG